MRSDNEVMKFMAVMDLRKALMDKRYGFLPLLHLDKLRIEVENMYQEMVNKEKCS
tara:strand:- start:136 stop:300 length:165 start_codon:yes stop_codon:yes gene_type:complete